MRGSQNIWVRDLLARHRPVDQEGHFDTRLTSHRNLILTELRRIPALECHGFSYHLKSFVVRRYAMWFRGWFLGRPRPETLSDYLARSAPFEMPWHIRP